MCSKLKLLGACSSRPNIVCWPHPLLRTYCQAMGIMPANPSRDAKYNNQSLNVCLNLMFYMYYILYNVTTPLLRRIEVASAAVGSTRPIIGHCMCIWQLPFKGTVPKYIFPPKKWVWRFIKKKVLPKKSIMMQLNVYIVCVVFWFLKQCLHELRGKVSVAL